VIPGHVLEIMSEQPAGREVVVLRHGYPRGVLLVGKLVYAGVEVAHVTQR
jgi:hypothetical protein